MNKTNRVILKITSTAALILGTAVLINPVQADTNIDFSATIAPSFSVTIMSGDPETPESDGQEAAVSIDGIMPSSAGTLRYSDLQIGVYSNSDIKYIVNMTTDSTALIGESNGEAIETLDEKDGGYTVDDFTSNRWGYSVGSIMDGEKIFSNYFPVKPGANAIATGKGMANGEPMTVRLGAKLDYLAVPDTYTTTLNFNIVADITDQQDL